MFPMIEIVKLNGVSKESTDSRSLVLHDPVRGYVGQDCCFLALVSLLSAAFYISRIGFYWDDWQVLKIFYFSANQSVIGLTRSMFLEWPEMMVRPIQAFQWAALYPLFGLRPLGYHLVSTATFFVGLCLCYLVLRTFTERRLFSLATTVVFASLPHYSTDRVWYAIWAANFSMVFYFLSLYGDLRQLTSGKSWIWPWKIISSVSLIISLLAYELFLPFFLLNPVLIALKRRQLQKAGEQVTWGKTRSMMFYLANPVLLAVISIFKSRTSTRTPGRGEYWWLVDNALRSSVDLTFGAYGFNLPHILRTISTKYWNWSSFLISLALVVVVAWYLIRASRTSSELFPRIPPLALIISACTLISGMSYSYLYSFYQVNTGVNNRVTIAAAVPVAVAWVSLAGLLSSVVRSRMSANYFFGLLIALMCGSGCLINNTIASFWVGASQKQHEILTEMKQHFSPPSGSSILLTGFCAWNGPGIVFEATWDVTGALALVYRDDTIRGELLWPWLKATEQGIPSGRDTSDRQRLYSFGSLYLYDVRTKQALQITDEKTASYYIGKAAKEDVTGCLTSGFGTGLPIW
jgi:hypothetical protein